jgi:transcription antitermination factor NusA-like protein
VQIEFGTQRLRSGRSNNAGSSEDTIYLSGQESQSVENLRKIIMDKLIEIEEDEKTRSYTTSFAFPDKFKNFLVGKQGSSINALREKYDVEIDTKETDKVTIKGPQKYADACKSEITRMGKQWADEVTYKLKVEPRFFGSLIGKNGENMTRWRERVDNTVTIQLPPKSKSDDSQSTADTSSDAGSHRNSRASQASDEILIRGPRQKADMIKSEIEGLYKWIKETSHEATVSVAKDQIRLLLGKGGQEMEKLRLATDAKIIVPKNEEVDSSSPRVTIRLQGSKEAVDKAKAELQKRSKAFDAIVTRKINIDQKFHRTIIGSGGKLKPFRIRKAPLTDRFRIKHQKNSN